jgi:hypothetical protein
MNRRSIGAACLVAGPLVYLSTRFIWPRGSEGSIATQAAAAAAHPGQWFTAGLLEAVSAWLLVPAAVAVASRLTGRGRTFGLIAAVLATLSSFAFSAEAAVGGALVELVRQPDRPRMVALWSQVMGSGYLSVFVVLLLAGLLGQVLLGWAALRGGLVRWWVPALITAGAVVVTLAPDGVEGTTAALLYLPVVVGSALFTAALLGRPRTVREPAATVPVAA